MQYFIDLIMEPTVPKYFRGADNPWNILWEMLLRALKSEEHWQSGKTLYPHLPQGKVAHRVPKKVTRGSEERTQD